MENNGITPTTSTNLLTTFLKLDRERAQLEKDYEINILDQRDQIHGQIPDDMKTNNESMDPIGEHYVNFLFKKYLNNENISITEKLILRRRITVNFINQEFILDISPEEARDILWTKSGGVWLLRKSSTIETGKTYVAISFSTRNNIGHYKIFENSNGISGIENHDGTITYFPSLIDALEEIKNFISAHGVINYAPLKFADDIKQIFDIKKSALVFAAYKKMAEEKFPLLHAAQNGELEKVKKLISEQADLELKNEAGFTPLIAAAEEGHLLVVKYLIKNGANVIAQNSKGFTALHSAAENHHLKVVQCLLNEKGPRERSLQCLTKSQQGFTPLAIAIQEGSRRIVEELLNYEDDVLDKECAILELAKEAKINKNEITKLITEKIDNLKNPPYVKLCREKGGIPYNNVCRCGPVDDHGQPTGRFINPYFDKCT